MAFQNKLKAFVRFDGSGRVIPSSLILQKSKPKVGNWKEINATQCCNTPVSPTTTSTTTNGSTSYAFNLAFWTDLNQACNFPATNNGLFYSSSPVLQTGSFLFYNANLTSPVMGIYINPSDNVRLTSVSGGYLQPYTCPTTTTTTTASPTTTSTTTATPFYSFNVDIIPRNDANIACASYGTLLNQMFSNVPTLTSGSMLYTDSALTSPFSGTGLDSWFAVQQNFSTFSIQVGRIADGNPGVILTGPNAC